MKISFAGRRGSLSMDSDSGPIVLTDIAGLGGPDGSIRTSTVPMKDGAQWLGSTAQPRSISVSGAITGTDVERGALRRVLAAALNARSGMLELSISAYGRERMIDAVVESGPTIREIEGERVRYQEFTLELYCPMPYFADMQETGKVFAAREGGLRWPLKLPARFTKLNVDGRYLCPNQGDVDCGITAIFTSGAMNPVLTCADTGEFIRIQRRIPRGKHLEIATGTGNKAARMIDDETGEATDAMGYIDLRSTFFALRPGANYLSFDADEGKSQTEVTVKWRALYAAF